MWPWGHLAVAYLCFLLLTRITDRVTQSFGTLTVLAIGSQFPDLIDKPLAWTVTILPSGRSFAHSLITAAITLFILDRLAARYGRRALVAVFGIGWVSHSLSDLGPEVIGGLLRGDASQLEWATYLVWPLLELPPYTNDSSFSTHFANFEISVYVGIQLLLCAVALGLWLGSGAPGLAAARTRIHTTLSRVR